MTCFLKLIILISIITFANSQVYIGGLFDGDQEQESAFNFAIERVNQAREEGKPEIIPMIENGLYNSFQSLNTTCNLIYNDVVAIFGPRIPKNIDAVQSVCDEKEIPHILTRWNYRPSRTGTIFNVYPHPSVLTRAYTDIILALEWKAFTILYDDDESFLRVKPLLETLDRYQIIVTIQQLDQEQTGDFRPVLKEVKKTDQKFFLIDCQIEQLKEILTQIQQIGIMNEDFHFLIINLDAHTQDLTPFQYSEANITGISLVNPESNIVKETAAHLYAEEEFVSFSGPSAWRIKSESALLIDAVTMFSNALDAIENTEPLVNTHLDCEGKGSFAHGYSLINFMKTMTFTGMTGLMQFNQEGFRSEFELNIFELKEGGILNVGVWNSSTGLNISRPSLEEHELPANSLQNRSFTVITALTDPYGMLKETHEVLYGNDRFEGFGIDLIDELSKMEGFNYTFIIRHDKKNGALENGRWTGMIGDLIDGTADLAITDLTITSERADAVDFTTPFMNLGISILFKKPGKAPPSFFSFADPFALETWLMLSLSLLIVSISLYVMGRLCPDEWTNPYPCIEEPEYLINQFSLANSIWFGIGSLMLQGSEIAPIAISTRMTAGVWWFFVLIMTASYTANLAAFLATENPIHLFKDVYGLVENAEEHGIRYGAKAGGATANFFRDSSNPLYQKIFDHMENHPEDMVKENQDGVDLADRENYAFFMESTTIEYTTQRHCDLQMYGGLLDEKGYGIAMRKDSPYRNKLSTAILKMKSSGLMDKLKRKWWEERKGGGQCNVESEAQEATPLDLQNVEGVFYVTIYGTCLSVILVFLEFLIFIGKKSKKTKLPFREVFRMELKSYFNFDSNVKPTIMRASKSRSRSDSEEQEENNQDMSNELKPVQNGIKA